LDAASNTGKASLACSHGFAVEAGDAPVGRIETPVFSGTSLEPDTLIVRTLDGIPGTFAAVPVSDVAEVDEAGRVVVLRCTIEELVETDGAASS
jgi:hypothetical protein